ncbi:MAG: sigma-54-dependent Fis family transcriptional regulator [Bryobacterales bacterium]|nr:sigma-54-dependent Fis family transcriptional regulator [Bryobacterales bacterium]
MVIRLPDSERLAAVLRICQRMNSERALPQLLDLVAEEAARLLDADRASIFLLSEDGRELTSKVALGSPQMIHFASDLGIAGSVVASGETVIVKDAYSDPRFYQDVDNLTGYRTLNLLAVPMTTNNGRVIGAFEILNKRDGCFEDDDVQLIKSLAANAAIAIQTARLIAELDSRRVTLEHENRNLWREVGGKLPSQLLLGTHPRMEELRRMIARIADTEITVLITGESGTGKDLVARSIHFASPRAARPFVALNCAALPEALLETELFGVEKGVATGVDRRAGKFESAQGGTIFLDEIGDLSLAAQAKILRVLQDHVVERIGGRTNISVDVRVIAATNKDLTAAMKKGEFREDLYYRLNVVHLKTPALREMPGDIPALANALLYRVASGMKRVAPPLSAAAIQVLLRSSWPGNVRQLENELRRATIVAQGPEILPSDFSEELTAVSVTPEPPSGLQQELEALERRRIQDALAANANNQQRTAKALGLSRQGLINKLKRYGIRTSPPREE